MLLLFFNTFNFVFYPSRSVTSLRLRACLQSSCSTRGPRPCAFSPKRPTLPTLPGDSKYVHTKTLLQTFERTRRKSVPFTLSGVFAASAVRAGKCILIMGGSAAPPAVKRETRPGSKLYIGNSCRSFSKQDKANIPRGNLKEMWSCAPTTFLNNYQWMWTKYSCFYPSVISTVF